MIMGPKKEFSFRFEKKGDFNYYCELHPTMMGKVTVNKMRAQAHFFHFSFCFAHKRPNSYSHFC